MGGGHGYGAIKFSSFGDFYEAQREAAEAIIRGLHGIACASWTERQRRGDTQDAPRGRFGSLARDHDRPHQTFTIDGPRGSGKTTLLQTLSGFVSLMRLDGDRITAGHADEEATRDELRALALPAPPGAGNRRTALVLPIVFTEDMDPLETTMEAVFAQLEQRLDEEADSRVGEKGGLLALRDDLRREVGVAWTFSQRIGAEALSQDALDYADFVERRADHNRRAYTRIGTWRAFVERYLDALGYELLVPLFDDSDLNANAAGDILRAIRMYFSHPRIAPILVAEVDNLSWTIFARELTTEHKALLAMKAADANGTSDYLGNFLGQVDANSDALLDKVLPVNLRYDLRPTSLGHIDHFFSRHDCGLGTVAASLEDWCHRHHVAAEDPVDQFAWFFLSGPYRRLVGDNVRSVIAFRDATAERGSKPLRALLRAQPIRDLGQKVSRNLAELDWLIESGQLRAGWDDEAEEEDGTVAGNGNGTGFGEAEAQFADLYVDIKIAQASLEVQGSELVGRWLPKGLLAGPAPRALSDPGKRLGVAGHLRSEPLPRSCLYVHQLRRLSGVAFRALPPPSFWSLWLSEGELANDDERLQRVVDSAAEVASVSKGFDAGMLQWLSLRSLVLRVVDKTPSSQFERDAPGFVAALYAATRPSVRSRTEMTAVLTDLAKNRTSEDLRPFLARLAEAVTSSERRRQEALFTWVAALELARSGDDDRRVERPQPRGSLAVSLAATAARPRFHQLVEQTSRAFQRGDRQAVLLAWSISPLLRDIHGYGIDYDDRSETVATWELLAEAFETLASTSAESSPPRVGDPWTYADIPSDSLAMIRGAVAETAKELREGLKPADAAGAVPVAGARKGWPAEPEALVASVLGTSRQWVRENIVPNA